jgi:hypothetical protein
VGIFAVQSVVIVLFLILSWAVRKKEGYWLISGFASRPTEEQEELICIGYPQKIGRLQIVTAIGLLILLPIMFTSFTYRIGVQFGFMLLFLMGCMAMNGNMMI